MTSDQTFEDLDARLSSDAINLFTRMVETHLAHRADAGDNLFLMPTDFAGELWFTGQKSAYTPNVRSAALNDLSSLGLLQRGSPAAGARASQSVVPVRTSFNGSSGATEQRSTRLPR